MAAPSRFGFMFVCKVVFVVLVALGVLFCSGHEDASEAAVAVLLRPPEYDPQCNSLWDVSPDCESWCRNRGHPGGYIKSDVCCCNSGGLDDDAWSQK